MAEKHDRFSLQAAIDFCLNSDESDYDPSVGALSKAMLLNNDFNNSKRYVFVQFFFNFFFQVALVFKVDFSGCS